MGETYCRVLEDGVEDDWRMQQAGPKLFPRWLHILHTSDSVDDDDGEWLLEKLKDEVEDVAMLIKYQIKDSHKMTKAFRKAMEELEKEKQESKEELDDSKQNLARHRSD